MIKIVYNDTAVGAQEAFVPSASGGDPVTKIDQIGLVGATFPKYRPVAELNGFLLDGTMSLLPDDTTDAMIGYWSADVTDINGNFKTPIVFTLIADELYISQGITITTTDAFPRTVNIKWYRGDTLLADRDFAPNSSTYYCEYKVESYNRIVITIPSLVLPYRRLILYGIMHGRVREFDGRQLADASVIQECSPISAETAINTLDFTLIGEGNIDYVFQSKQSLELYHNDELLGIFFVRSYQRTAQQFYSVSSEDYLGLLDAVPFAGGIYTARNAYELLTAIFAGANVPLEMDSSLRGETVTGWIPVCTCREAVRQICFAIGAAVDTSLSTRVRIFAPPQEIAHRFAPEEIMQGQTLRDREKKLTEVRLTVHGYTKGEKTETVYEAEESGTGEGIYVEFNEPMHDLTITGGVIVESGANYAIIDAYDGCVLAGTPYNHTKSIRTMHNPLVNAGEPANVVSVESMTLVSASNADARLKALYDYYIVQGVIRSDLVMARASTRMVARPADKVQIATVYAGTQTARLESMRYKLYGGAIVADTEAH
jgi:hypothetical protein